MEFEVAEDVVDCVVVTNVVDRLDVDELLDMVEVGFELLLKGFFTGLFLPLHFLLPEGNMPIKMSTQLLLQHSESDLQYVSVVLSGSLREFKKLHRTRLTTFWSEYCCIVRNAAGERTQGAVQDVVTSTDAAIVRDRFGIQCSCVDLHFLSCIVSDVNCIPRECCCCS